MANYSIEVSRTAERQLRRLKQNDQIRVLREIQGLAREPYPPGCRKLRGYDDVFRVRVGSCRVLYSVEGHRLLVIIFKVGHRREVYR